MNYGISFLFSILIVCYFLGGCVVQVKAHSFICWYVVKPYIECKHLNVSRNNYDNYDSNDELLNATLGNIGLEEALDMQRHIFVLLTNNSECSSDLCRCFNGAIRLRPRDTRFGFAFRDETVYAQFKRIILDYANEHGMIKEEMSLEEKLFRITNRADLNFCSEYDIFSDEGRFFRSFNIPPCLNELTNPTTKRQKQLDFFDCLLPHMYEVKFRSYLVEPLGNSIDLKPSELVEKLAVCTGKSIGLVEVCSRTERRYILASIFSVVMKNLWNGVTNMTASVDSLSDRMTSKDLVRQSVSAWIDDWDQNFTIKTLNGTLVFKHMSQNQNISLFSSPMLNITANIHRLYASKTADGIFGDYYRKIKAITISSMFDLSTPEHAFNRTFDLYAQWEELSSDNLIQNPLDYSQKTWIRFLNIKSVYFLRRNFKFFDMKWNVTLTVDNSYFQIVMPESLASQASGGLLLAN